MDDDDALAASYCSQLCSYLERGVIGFPITFAYGYEGYFDHLTGEFSDLRHWYYPKIALGLAFTNGYSDGKYHLNPKSVYGLGSHTRIDVDRSIIVDSVSPLFFRTVSAHNDSGGYRYHDYLPKVERGELSTSEFPFIKSNLPEKTRSEGLIVEKAASSHTAMLRAETRKLKHRIKSLEAELSPKA